MSLLLYPPPSDTTRKTRIIDVVYNASNNELVRTKTLVKNAIVQIDSTPFRQWYEAHYALPLARKKGAKLVSFSFKRNIVIVLYVSERNQNSLYWRAKQLCNVE